MLGDQVDHLAADHAGGARRLGERGDQLAAHRRIAMRVGMRPAPRRPWSAARRRRAPRSPRRTPCGRSGGRAADRCCPSPADRHAPANRHGPSRSRGDLQRAAPRHREELRAGQHEERPQPFAGRQRGIAHRLEDARLEARRHGEQLVERRVGELRRIARARPRSCVAGRPE